MLVNHRAAVKETSLALTIREKKKRDKAIRIKDAARSVFADKGYRQATMREVAEAAGVATGTLFLYAADKRDLLILTVIDDLDRLTTESAATLKSDDPLLEQLLDAFRPRYVYWAGDRRLAMTVLQEVQETHSDYAPDSAMARYQRHRDSILTTIVDIVERQQRAGTLSTNESPQTLARLINLIYSTAVRYWLRGVESSVDDGMAVLRDYLRIALSGVMLPG
jgi:AcrR family transcriptional regulator